ncbi:transducin beta-like protein 3 [Drosophila guanche]|uniref:Blast:Transducin beta-like protein 3 n=1 Tax=Drosophila guanche TaxID=7266 RepID=A0A3B0J5N6_DROGU|nr:transducin beta-like protein 3 [Drosophila guanche]SPP74992.1 blast:Transducin beta-like protein 3 [Drosophila guanche]
MLANICEKSYAAEAQYTNFYGGGDIAWSSDGQHFYCLSGAAVNQVDVQTSQILQSFGVSSATVEKKKPTNLDDIDVEEDAITCFALSHEHLVTAHRSGLLRLWLLSTCKLVKLWKAQHKGPVIKIEFSPCGRLVCTSGGADATLRLWDFANNSCLCALKDFPGPCWLLRFHPNVLRKEIYAVGSDNTIYCWNYQSKALLHKMRGHLSQVTGLSFKSNDAECNKLATVSRDKVLIVWELEDQVEGKQLKVLPLFDELEGVVYANEGREIVVASRTGNLLQVDAESWKIKNLLSQSDFQINRLLHCNDLKQLALVTTEQNIIIYDASSIEPVKHLVGYNDEILDMCFLGDNDRYLAVATNSKHFKLYDTENDMNCKLIVGHSDTVMALAGSHNLLISVGKDCSIRLWKLEHEKPCSLEALTQQTNCHTSTIGCVAMTHNGAAGFASVCQDGSMKVWNLSRDKQERNSYTFNLRYSALAHDKEVNCVAYAVNNKILATASQDKTAKLWMADSNSLLGVLRGHTRGVWSVRFSPVDQVVLTSSSDCTLRLWSISNFTCIKRFDQECTILRAEFLDHGKFIVSAASDGLLKLWNIKTNTCLQSLDEHTDRVWALAVSGRSNRFFYTGGADSKLIRFGDVTQATRNEALDQRQETLEQEQTLHSLLHAQKQLHKAFVLALNLNKPKTTFDIIVHFVRERDEAGLRQLVDQLNVDQRVALLQHVKAWTTNSRNSHAANVILKHLIGDALLDPKARFYNNGNMVEVLTPYVQRHFKRITEMNKELAFLEFIVKCM